MPSIFKNQGNPAEQARFDAWTDRYSTVERPSNTRFRERYYDGGEVPRDNIYNRSFLQQQQQFYDRHRIGAWTQMSPAQRQAVIDQGLNPLSDFAGGGQSYGNLRPGGGSPGQSSSQRLGNIYGDFMGRQGEFGAVGPTIGYKDAISPGEGYQTDLPDDGRVGVSMQLPTTQRKDAQLRLMGYAGQSPNLKDHPGDTDSEPFQMFDPRQGTLGGIQMRDRTAPHVGAYDQRMKGTVTGIGYVLKKQRERWLLSTNGVGLPPWMVEEYQRAKQAQDEREGAPAKAAMLEEMSRMPETADQYRAMANLGIYGPAGMEHIEDVMNKRIDPVIGDIQGRLPQIMDANRRSQGMQRTAAARGLAQNLPSRISSQPGMAAKIIGDQVLSQSMMQEAGMTAELMDRYGGRVDDINLNRAGFMTDLVKENMASKAQGLAGLERTMSQAMQAYFGITSDEFRNMDASANRALQERLARLASATQERMHFKNLQAGVNQRNADRANANQFSWGDAAGLGLNIGKTVGGFLLGGPAGAAAGTTQWD